MSWFAKFWNNLTHEIIWHPRMYDKMSKHVYTIKNYKYVRIK